MLDRIALKQVAKGILKAEGADILTRILLEDLARTVPYDPHGTIVLRGLQRHYATSPFFPDFSDIWAIVGEQCEMFERELAKLELKELNKEWATDNTLKCAEQGFLGIQE